MNLARQIDPGWTRRRLAVVSGLIFVGQVAFVFLLSERNAPITPPAASATKVAMITSPRKNQNLLDHIGANDPTLLALANPEGFSGSPWINYAPPGHRPPDWSEPERWLKPDAQALGQTLGTYVRTNAALVALSAYKPSSAPTPVEVPPKELPKQSALHVDGEIAARMRSQSGAALPVWAHTNLLADSVVQIMVDARGDTHSAVLVGGGVVRDAVQSEADQFALRWCRTNRFQPLPDRKDKLPLASGTVVFEWHTQPPPPVALTNRPVANPVD